MRQSASSRSPISQEFIMARLHRILFGAAAFTLAGVAVAQSSTEGAGAAPAGNAAVESTNPANNAATDPYVQRREARKQAKTEYKEKKKAAKQEYKEEKKEANAKLKEPGAQADTGNATYPSSGK
jgi:hypothetical protein